MLTFAETIFVCRNSIFYQQNFSKEGSQPTLPSWHLADDASTAAISIKTVTPRD